MFEQVNGEVPFETVCQCIIEACKGKILSSPNDLLAVVLYGCKERKGDFDGVYVLYDLDGPSVELIKAMDDLSRTYTSKSYGHWDRQEEFPLSDAFWTASSLLAKTSKTHPNRRVFIFTNQDNPHADQDQLEQAKRRIEDFTTSGIVLQLFAFDTRSHDFRLQPFYHLVQQQSGLLSDYGGVLGSVSSAGSLPAMDSRVLESWKASSRLTTMLERVRAKSREKRSLATLAMTLVPGVELALKVFMVAKAEERPKFVWLDPDTTAPVQPDTSWICQDIGCSLRAPQIKTYLPYGGSKVILTKEERGLVRSPFPPGITLLGFKARSSLKDWHNLTHSVFVFPDDKTIKGSTTTFMALLHQCLLQDKIAIVRYVARAISAPRLAAMLPQREVWENEIMVQPSGFYLVQLPFADDIRDLEVNTQWEETKPTPSQVLSARKMVQTLNTEYDPDIFTNPDLNKFYNALEAYALEEQVDEIKVEDNFQPDLEAMEHFQNIIDEWKDTLPPGYEGAPQKKPAAKKRSAPGGGGDDDGDDPNEWHGDWEELVSNDSNKRKVTIPHIKAKLKAMKVSMQGKSKKDDLWEILKTAIEQAPKKVKKEEPQ